MSHKINRLIKNKNREGKIKVFFDIQITDDLGTYSFGKWLTDEEYTAFKADFDSKDFEKCVKLSDFKAKKAKINVIDTIIASYLPQARQNQIDNLEAIEREKLHLGSGK